MADDGALKIAIACDEDVVPARAKGRELASEPGFSATDATLTPTAISEIARNILVHAGAGEVRLTPAYEDHRYGLVVEARDSGPGIRGVVAALSGGYGTKGGLGLGLPGVNRIMDELDIDTAIGRGTKVSMAM